jgi:hypothetical protein
LQVKKETRLVRVIVSVCILSSLIYADNTKINISSMGIKPEVAKIASISTSYQGMSTEALESEVERLTANGVDIPFDMGMELIKRWTKG